MAFYHPGTQKITDQQFPLLQGGKVLMSSTGKMPQEYRGITSN